MSTQQLSEPTGLANLPSDIHLEIFSYLCPMGGTRSLVTACKSLYNNLIIEFYKESGPQLNWLPLLVAISQDNIDILDKCLKAGASLDHRWPYLGEFGRSNDLEFFRCCQPLDLATWYGQDDVLRWLVHRGAVATDEERPHFIKAITTDHFVSDVTTAEGRWKPALYQQETCQQETYPFRPYPHFVWHSPELRPTEIFLRLLRLYKTQFVDPFYDYHTQSRSEIYLDNWIDWIWRDMLLSASDPVPILESAFFIDEHHNSSLLRWSVAKPASITERLRSEFSADMFGQKLLLNSVAPRSDHPFPKHVSLRAPEVFNHLLNSHADTNIIFLAYRPILDYLLHFESSRLNVFPTLELYPLITYKTKALFDLSSIVDRIYEMVPNLNDWETNVAKIVLKVRDSGVPLTHVRHIFRDGHEFARPCEVPVFQVILSTFDAIQEGKL